MPAQSSAKSKPASEIAIPDTLLDLKMLEIVGLFYRLVKGNFCKSFIL